jgi:hypothetical protein
MAKGNLMECRSLQWVRQIVKVQEPDAICCTRETVQSKKQTLLKFDNFEEIFYGQE